MDSKHHLITEYYSQMNRRHFLSKMSLGFGTAALGSLLGCGKRPSPQVNAAINPLSGLLEKGHFPFKAKRIIYLFQSGGPSQLELYDYKPTLRTRHGEDLPESIRMGQRLTGMTAFQATKPMAGSMFEFQQYGQSGAWISELLPKTAEVVDDLCFIKTLHTEAINHDPAITFFQTGSQQPGRPSMGSWLSYGLGSTNDNLPTFVVLLSRGAQRPQPIYFPALGQWFSSLFTSRGTISIWKGSGVIPSKPGWYFRYCTSKSIGSIGQAQPGSISGIW